MAVNLSDCSFERVVVYSDRSECKRVIHFDVKSGENDILIYGLPHFIESESIRVEGKSIFQNKNKSCQPIINDVIYFSSFDISKIISVIESDTIDNISVISNEISSLQKDSDILRIKIRIAEKKMKALSNISSFVDIFPSGSNLHDVHSAKGKILKDRLLSDVKDLQTFTPSGIEYFETFDKSTLNHLSNYLNFFSNSYFAAQHFFNSLSNELSSVSNRIQALQLNRKQQLSCNKYDKSTKFCKAIKVIVESREECKICLIFTYLCSNASWNPFYQLSFSTEKNELELYYFGIVKQGTGENWKTCSISLSTSSPLLGKPPILVPQTLAIRFHSHLNLIRANSITGLMGRYDEVYNFSNNDQNFVEQIQNNQMNQQEFQNETQDQSTTLKESQAIFTHTFMASRPTSIPSNNTEHKVSLALLNIFPEFQHISQPEINSNAYLQARVINSSEFPLLAGYCSVFLDGNFLSKTNLPNVSPQEQFFLSLGVDSQVKVIYFKGHKHRKRQKGLFSKSNSAIYEFKKYLDVRNNRATLSKIMIRHCLPLSQDDRVKVVLLEPLCKKQNLPLKLTPNLDVTLSSLNQLEWQLRLEPNEYEKIYLKYQIEYPYGMYLNGFD